MRLIQVEFPADWSVGEANVVLREYGFPPGDLKQIDPLMNENACIGSLFTFHESPQTLKAVKLLIYNLTHYGKV